VSRYVAWKAYPHLVEKDYDVNNYLRVLFAGIVDNEQFSCGII